MFLLRRTALRAALSAAKPSSSLVAPKTRTFVSLNQSKLHSARQWTPSSMQKRFASDDAAATQKPTEETLEERAEEEMISEETRGAAGESPLAETESAEPAEVIEEVVAEIAPKSETPAETVTERTSSTNAAAASAIAGAAATRATTQRSESSRFEGQPSPNTTLYVGNIFFEVNEQSLEDYFSRFGTILKTRLVFDSRGLSKGFGYVEFENMDDAVRALEGANQQVFQGRRLAVQFHRPRQPINRRPQGAGANPPSKTLFIGNMSFEMSDKDLSDLFREVRNVIDVRIAIDRRTGQPRGFAHADFIDTASAMKALEFLKGKELYGRQLRVDYSLSTPRTADS